MPNLKHLYYYHVFVNELSLSRAAKRLCISAPALANQLKQLDETYGRLEKDLRSQYLLAYNSQSTTKDRVYRKVEVKTSRPGMTVRTIRGFIP